MSPSLLLLAVLAATASAPPPTDTTPQQLDLAAAAVDPAATAAGLRARAGPRLDGWTISVRDTATANEVEAVLRSPAGEQRRRRLTLTGTTTDDRSRELAASLALLVEEDAPEPEPVANPEPEPPPPAKPRGWLGLGPRLEVGSPPAGGLDLSGGAWLVRDHLQPLANLAWSSTASQGLRLHSLRIGAGMAAGAPLKAGRIWLGGHVLLHAQWVQARDATVASAWTAATEVGGLVQVRWSRVVLAARTGVDLNFPPLTLRGAAAQISRGPAAWLLAINFGFVFG